MIIPVSLFGKLVLGSPENSCGVGLYMHENRSIETKLDQIIRSSILLDIATHLRNTVKRLRNSHNCSTSTLIYLDETLTISIEGKIH